MEIVLFLIRLAVLASLYVFLVAVFLTIRYEFSLIPSRQDERESTLLRSKLVVLDAGETEMAAGDILRLEARTSIGRSLENTIVLLDSSVSARHATLIYQDDRWWLQDSNSTNGTTLNGNLIKSKSLVHQHDVVGLGQIQLRLEIT